MTELGSSCWRLPTPEALRRSCAPAKDAMWRRRSRRSSARPGSRRGNERGLLRCLPRVLEPSARRAFLERVDVIDGAATAVAMQPALERAVRKSVKLQRRAALVDRLRGWWHKRAIAHLDAVARHQNDRITSAELEEQLPEIADSLRKTRTCPLTCSTCPSQATKRCPRATVSSSSSAAVGRYEQRTAACASMTHNRAFAQRSIWQRDRLLEIGELGQAHLQELKEAWERFSRPSARTTQPDS